MAENSKIELATHTFNPWEGCQKVGPGCDHCYAETRNARFGGGAAPNWGPGAPRRRTSESNWRKPYAWQADAVRFHGMHGRRQRVFCASLADVFDNAVHPDWRSDLFQVIRETPDLDWLLLTKRIGNVQQMLADDVETDRMPSNVWLGATIVNQAEADRDIPKLLAVPAAKRFLSIEPLLGSVDLTTIAVNGDHELDAINAAPLWEDEVAEWRSSGDADWEASFEDWYGVKVDRVGPMHATLDWIIVGGESGSGARPMHPDWARSLRDQCAAAGVPFLFKQWGEHSDFDHIGMAWNDLPDRVRGQQQFLNGKAMIRLGKKAAGRLLDGVQHDAMPA